MVHHRKLVMLSLLFNLGCSVFGVRTSEELKYSVVESHDDFEIRTYAPYISAQASLTGEYRAVQGDLFRLLAGYIFGKNSTRDSIEMTAPVLLDSESREGVDGAGSRETLSETQSESIAMTAPVTMQPGGDGQWTMSFSMPSKYTMGTLPKPTDARVRLLEVPERTVAVIRFSGRFGDEERRAENARSLLKWLAESKWYKATGKPFYAGYDPPFTLPFLRRNELLIDVQPL